jgi:hypothetical protein
MIHNQICPWCNHSIQPIDVHGHSQCPNCKINIDPCCSGENSQCEPIVNMRMISLCSS